MFATSSSRSRRGFSVWSGITSVLLLGGQLAGAIELNLKDAGSIKRASRTVADGMMNYYTGNQTGDIPGNLPEPYYWWEVGAMFGALIDYYYYTGDTTYNDVVTEGMLFQVGPDDNFMPPNQTKTEGNDDQAFWGLAALSAAENKFPDPPEGKPQWLALAQAVFNSQALRWDDATCKGGLRWQIFTFNNGYNYKNTISNGCFFNMAARLAIYTGNQTYADWAEKTWDWMKDIGLMSPEYKFFDGTDVSINCTAVDHHQWSYNAGTFLSGAASMYNFTKEQKWADRTSGILNATSVFFSPKVPKVMYEVACEPYEKCNVDQKSFKAYLSRWMAATTKMAPFLTDQIMPYLEASANAAAKQCSGGTDGVTCGIKWTQPNWDGSFGVGEQMSALEVIQSNLITQTEGPATAKKGGTSKGDPSAGMGGDSVPSGVRTEKVTSGDRVGAGFLTTLVCVGVIGGAWWMVAK
ncbi:MAG: hydrolase 76 protein [Sclerophora amabilis]|nr:MAG: hydrolase 76 protein [Sclerophora amabilis]